LLVTLLVLSVLCAVSFVAPMRLARRASTRGSLGALSYFAAIGVGFLLFEIALIQRLVLFLGFPTYALSVVLFSLLVSSGLGSYVSSRLSPPRIGLVRALSAALLLLVIGSVGLPPVLAALMHLSLPARAMIAVLVVAPFGFLLGIPMPLGLGRLAGIDGALVPYAWGINGMASVLASVLGVFIATELGFTATSLSACACYGFALLHAAVGKWPA
jgi:hypothetical protein